MTPLFGAYVADKYLGRYKTICYCVAIALVGHVLLIISAVPTVVTHSHGSLACFVIALIVMGSGTGGFKSNVSAFCALTLHIDGRLKCLFADLAPRG